MGDLPKSRLIPNRPFAIELSIDLTTESFLNCLKRFFSRRGFSSEIYSGNGTNFVRAKNYLRKVSRELFSPKNRPVINHFCPEKSIQWHFSPPRSPHFGGIWKAIKSAKILSKRIIGETKLTFDQFYTILTQVETCLNSRSLTPLSNHPNDLQALTPGHFLIGEALHSDSTYGRPGGINEPP